MRFVSAPLALAAFFGLHAPAQAHVRVDVDLSSQTMHVSSAHGDYDWAVSTGRPGHRTPTGVYHPQRMYTMTYSRKYEDAPMPHAIFFTGGYAIHATYSTGLLGQVASHGCIRLAPQNAATLYDLVKHEGATIEISGHAPGSDAVAVTERHRGRKEVAARRIRLATPEVAEPDVPSYHRAAVHWERLSDEGLAYAPRRAHRSLRAWADNPLESQ